MAQTLASSRRANDPRVGASGTCSKSSSGTHMRWKPARAAKSSKLGLASIGPVVLTVPGIARVSVPGSLQAGGGRA